MVSLVEPRVSRALLDRMEAVVDFALSTMPPPPRLDQGRRSPRRSVTRGVGPSGSRQQTERYCRLPGGLSWLEMCIPKVSFGAQQRSRALRLPAPTAKHTELRSAAGAVGAADRARVGDRAHPLGRRTTRQNDGHRHPDRSAERHIRCARNQQASSALGGMRQGAKWSGAV